MKKNDNDPGMFLPLTEATYAVLLSLAEARHGYGVMQDVSQATGGEIRLGPGTLYGVLTKLLGQGLITRAGESGASDERRKLYVLTDLGRAVAAAECLRLDRLAALGKKYLNVTGEGQ